MVPTTFCGRTAAAKSSRHPRNSESGYFSNKTAYAIREWLGLPGQLFLAYIQMIVIPLIMATVIGITLALFLRPGDYIEAFTLLKGSEKPSVQEIQSLAEELLGPEEPFQISEMPQQITDILPKNPMSSIVEG